MAHSIPLKSLSLEVGDTPDVLICSASFEERCVAVPLNVASDSLKHALVFHNRALRGLAQQNLRKLRSKFGRKLIPVGHDGSGPIAFADIARPALARVLDVPAINFLIDITTFTHENLLILLSLLREMKREADTFTVTYAAAADYGEWLSRGFSDVRSVLGYPGEMRPSQGEHLIVLCGYEADRAERLIRTYEPAHLSVGHCNEFASIAPHLHQRNLEFHKRLLQFRSQVDTFDFGCDDPSTACEHILREVRRVPGYNAVVAPMNTKLSTVGSALAAFQNPAIQLCYVPAHEYNEPSYSLPGEMCYVFKLTLSP
ncbi:MAG: hypothetical protein JWM27_2800 [Gemmatimonadetes bacterium]|nr:hypothetical protein [Gemmatimonadota bacterium]